jgi:hypothetical protein
MTLSTREVDWQTEPLFTREVVSHFNSTRISSTYSLYLMDRINEESYFYNYLLGCNTFVRDEISLFKM